MVSNDAHGRGGRESATSSASANGEERILGHSTQKTRKTSERKDPNVRSREIRAPTNRTDERNRRRTAKKAVAEGAVMASNAWKVAKDVTQPAPNVAKKRLRKQNEDAGVTEAELGRNVLEHYRVEIKGSHRPPQMSKLQKEN